MIPSAVRIIFVIPVLIKCGKSANILAVFPTPSISHQLVFRPLTLELAKRGHQVSVITPDPVFQKHDAPANLTEFDVHDISYKLWKQYVATVDGDADNQIQKTKTCFSVILSIFEEQFRSFDVQKMISDKNIKFDLLILESFVQPVMSYSHLYNVPVISINSFGTLLSTFDSVDSVSHPLIFPIAPLQRFHNITTLQKVTIMYDHYTMKNLFVSLDDSVNKQLKRIFGPEIPDLKDLRKNIHMTFLNTHPIWDNNRPVSPNIIYVGGIYQSPVNELPKDLKVFLDQSTKGVIYMSFGSNFMTTLLPTEKLKIFLEVFSALPYNVLLKWDDDLPGCPSNVVTGKWFPQSALLRHKNVKTFITHGGYQSMSESVDAGVPLIGIPMAADQWYNIEVCVQHEIGIKLDLKTLTEEILKGAIEAVIENDSYHKNINRIRNQIHDQPQTALERAVWWTEYVLRHGGAKHLKSAAAHLHWTEYYEINLILILLFTVFTLIFVIYLSIKFVVKKILLYNKSIKVD